MDYNLTPEQKMIQRVTREFTLREIEPIAAQIDKEDKVPSDMHEKMAKAGLFKMEAPKKYGGSEAGCLSCTLAVEQISYGSLSCYLVVWQQNCFSAILAKFGTEEQKDNYIRRLCDGKAIASVAFTEPATGSDPKAIMSRAELDGDYYVLNGTKRFTSLAPCDGPALIFAKDDTGRVSAFLIDKNIPGYSTSKLWDKMGFRGHELADVFMDNMRVPETTLFWEKGKGYDLILHIITDAKLANAAAAVGLAQAALDEAIKYAKERTVKDRPIASMQAIQWLIAEMAAKVEAARWLTYRVAFLEDQGVDIRKDAALVKLFASQVAVQVATMALQVHGSYGYMKEFKVERLYRDAKACEVMEGSNELQRTIVSGYLLA